METKFKNLEFQFKGMVWSLVLAIEILYAGFGRRFDWRFWLPLIWHFELIIEFMKTVFFFQAKTFLSGQGI